MTDSGRSGSRWEPDHRPDEPADEVAQPGPPPVGGSVTPTRSAPGAVPPATWKRKQLPAALAAGLVLAGGAGGWAIGSAVVRSGDPAVEQTGTDDGAGRLPDPDGEGSPDVDGRGGGPDVDGDDGPAPRDGSGHDGAIDDDGDAAGAGDPA